MSNNVIYIGLDVDDTQYHGGAVDKRSGEVVHFQCRPTLKGLIHWLEQPRDYFPGCSLDEKIQQYDAAVVMAMG
jgi:hypothetical protein